MARTTIDVTPGTGASIDFDTQNSRDGQVIVLRASAAEDLVPATLADGLLVNLGSNNDVTVSGTVTVQDGGNTITVDGSVTADTELTTADLDTGAGTDTRAVIGLVGSASGGGQLIPGSATDGLLVNLGANNDVTVTGTVTIAGAVTNAGTFAVQDSQKIADNGGFTDGTTPVQPAGFIYDEVAGTALTENDVAAARIDSKRAQVHIIEDGATRGRWATVSAANALKVDGSAVTQPVSGTVTANLAAGTNNIGDIDVLTVPADPFGANADAAVAAGATGSIQAKLRRATQGLEDLKSLIVLAAGNNNIGDVDVASIAAGTNLVGDVGIQPRTTNGLDTFMASGSDGSSILVATAQAVKASAGKVYGWFAYNPEAAVTFAHFYDTASGSVTVGTTSPKFTLQIPAGAAANVLNDIGITFGTAITIAATTTAGGNTAPSTGVSLEVFYK